MQTAKRDDFESLHFAPWAGGIVFNIHVNEKNRKSLAKEVPKTSGSSVICWTSTMHN